MVTGESATTRGRIDAIDGLRAISVLAVIAFHSDAWLPGGYLGVSVFFTISGFVIGRNLFIEQERRGTIDLPRFYGRRVRRLLPASLLCAALIVVAQQVFGTFAADTIRDEILWVVVPVYNWFQLAQDHSYADLFVGSQSPFIHYWSLAIEEQIYLVLPLAVLGGFALARSVRARHVLIGAVTVAAAVAPLIIYLIGGAQPVYYATYARFAEVAVGVALAWMVHHDLLSWPGRFALPALIGLLAVMPLTGATEDAWPYRGGLALLALVTATVIAGCLPGLSASALRRGLGWAPLAYIGRISYGVYLFHWPIALIVADQLPESSRPVRFTLTLLFSVGLAAASFAWFEVPFQRMRTTTLRTIGAAFVASALVVVGARLTLTPEQRPTVDIAAYDETRAAAVQLDAVPRTDPTLTATTTSTTTTTPATTTAAAATGAPSIAPSPESTALATTTVAPAPLRVLVTGDSTAVAIGEGVVDHLFLNPADGQVSVLASGVCGLLSSGELALPKLNYALLHECPLTRQAAADAVATTRPDAVIVIIAVADSWPRSFDGRRTWIRPTDPQFAERLRADYAAFAEQTLQGARCIVWVQPTTSWLVDDGRFVVDPIFVNGSQAVVDDVVTELVAEHPGRMVKLDLGQWFEGRGDPGADGRPDGLHVDRSTAGEIAGTWLWPQLRAAGVGTPSCASPG